MMVTQWYPWLFCLGTALISYLPVNAAAVDCGPPPAPRNGSLENFTSTTEGSVVSYSCDPGLVPEGRLSAMCTGDGWSPNPGDLNCSEFPRCRFPTFGASAVNVTIYNTTKGILMTSYTCHDGSIGHLQCVADDTWSSDPARVCMDTFKELIIATAIASGCICTVSLVVIVLMCFIIGLRLRVGPTSDNIRYHPFPPEAGTSYQDIEDIEESLVTSESTADSDTEYTTDESTDDSGMLISEHGGEPQETSSGVNGGIPGTQKQYGQSLWHLHLTSEKVGDLQMSMYSAWDVDVVDATVVQRIEMTPTIQSSLPVPTSHSSLLSPSYNAPGIPQHCSLPEQETQGKKLSQKGIPLPSVPYMDPVEVVMCDSAGGIFYSSTHDFGFAIPEGAIPEGDSINIEVGVTLTGPFDFPQGSKPVSPIVKLCVQQQPNYQFLKPVEVVLPHYLDFTSEENNSGLKIGFLKAGHTLNSKQEYKFEPMDSTNTHFKHEYYGILRTNHFCLLCIGQGITRSDTATACFYLLGYCKILPDPTMWKVYICVAYFLKSCVEVVRKQFPVADYHEIFTTVFKFANQPPSERKIEIKLEEGRDSREWELALQSADKIKASDVDFWSIDEKDLELMQEERKYPPRFQIQAYASRCVCIPIFFQGTAEDIKIDLLLKPANPVNHTDARRVTSMESEPKLRDLMNKVAAKLPNKWWQVGTQLESTADELETLRTSHGGSTAQCFTMVFDTWKKRTDNYSWAAIITALETPLVRETRLAEELKVWLGDPSCENLSAHVQNRGDYQQKSLPLNLARKETRFLAKLPSSETWV